MGEEDTELRLSDDNFSMSGTVRQTYQVDIYGLMSANICKLWNH